MAEALRPNFNAAKPRLRRFRLQVSDRDPITRPQPLAQIAVASALADLIFDDAQDAPQQEMRGVDPRGRARHRLAASPELGDRVALRPQQAQPIGIVARASCGVVAMRHALESLPESVARSTSHRNLAFAILAQAATPLPSRVR